MWTQQVIFRNKSFKKIKKTTDQSTVLVIEKYDVER